ncbi:hypothetical protein U1Q18_047474 [Sarracenia purpurea var. burkii]
MSLLISAPVLRNPLRRLSSSSEIACNSGKNYLRRPRDPYGTTVLQFLHCPCLLCDLVTACMDHAKIPKSLESLLRNHLLDSPNNPIRSPVTRNCKLPPLLEF